MNQEYYIGQIFEKKYPLEATTWCDHNNAVIVEIDRHIQNVEEEYEELETVVVPTEYDIDGKVISEEHEEQHMVTKTRTVERILRVYQIQAVPEPSIDEKKKEVRWVRDGYIGDIEWRVSRYRDQIEMQIETTDTEETYIKILQYMQYLRDYPESSETWYEQNPITWDEYCEQVD